MEWKDESTKRAVVLQSKMMLLTATLLHGHIDDPDEWLLSTQPDIFRGFTRMGADLEEDEAKVKAENLIAERLSEMLGGLCML